MSRSPTVPLTLLPALAALAVCANCGAPVSEAPSTATTAATPPAGLLLDSVGTIGLEHLYTIGALDGPPEYAFGQVASVAPRADGGFYICDLHDMQVRSYDSTGRFIAKIGRRGGGPAEYYYCEPLLVLGDTLAVNDMNQRRVILFTESGALAGVVRWPIAYPATVADPSGRFWAEADRGSDDRSGIPRVMTLAIDRRGQVRDSIRLPARIATPGFHSMYLSNENGDFTAKVDSLFTLIPGGRTAAVRTDVYSVTLRGPSVDSLTFGRDVGAIEYRHEERAEWQAYIDAAPTQPQLPLPRSKPIIRGLRGDDAGRVWVKLADTSYRREPRVRTAPGRPRLTHGEQGVWDIFDGADGDYIGQLRVPVGTEVMGSRGDVVWLRGSGPDDEWTISAFRLRAVVAQTKRP